MFFSKQPHQFFQFLLTCLSPSLCLFIHIFFKQAYTKHLLCARHSIVSLSLGSSHLLIWGLFVYLPILVFIYKQVRSRSDILMEDGLQSQIQPRLKPLLCHLWERYLTSWGLILLIYKICTQYMVLLLLLSLVR